MPTERNAAQPVPGIEQRHGNECPLPIGENGERIVGEKDCGCPWRASVYSKRDRKKFPTQAEAKSWREDESYAVRKKLRRAPTPDRR